LNEVVPICSNFIKIGKIYPNDLILSKFEKNSYNSTRHF